MHDEFVRGFMNLRIILAFLFPFLPLISPQAAFSQSNVQNLGQDRPADMEIDETFVPETPDQWLAAALGSQQNIAPSLNCVALNLRYYHGFADNEKITGSTISFGEATSSQYKAAKSLPISFQNYNYREKSYWKPVTAGFIDVDTFKDRYLSEHPERTDEQAEREFIAKRNDFVKVNPDGQFVGWMKWNPILYKEPLAISAALAAKLKLPAQTGLASYIVPDNKAKHDKLLAAGHEIIINPPGKIPNTSKVKPIIYLKTIRFRGVVESRYWVAFEYCVRPSVHKISGNFNDLYLAERARIVEMIDEGSVLFVNPSTLALQPGRYNHAIDDAPVQLAFWNHLRGRMLTLQQRTNEVELAKVALQLPGYFAPITSAGLALRDYYNCKEAAEPACLAALALDASTSTFAMIKIAAKGVSIANGYAHTTKAAGALKRLAEAGQQAETYLTGAHEIIRNNSRATQIIGAAGNITLAAVYAAEEDIEKAIQRTVAGAGNFGFFLIGDRAFQYIPLRRIRAADCEPEQFTKVLKTVSSNVDEFQVCSINQPARVCAEIIGDPDSIDEAQQLAFRIYQNSGFIDSTNFPNGRFAQPATLTNPHRILAFRKESGELSRSLTLIAQGRSKLPIENYFPDEVAGLLKSGKAVEISTFVVEEGGDCININDALVEFMGKSINYARSQGARYLLLGANPRHVVVYRRALGFNTFKRVDSYGSLHDAPVQLAYMDLNQFEDPVLRQKLFQSSKLAEPAWKAAQTDQCLAH